MVILPMQKLMSVKELAEYLDLSQRTIYNMIGRDEIPFIKIGGQYRFKRNQIDEWLEQESRKLPETGLDKVKQTADPLTKRLLFMGLLTKALEPQGIKPVVVGGNAVEFYTAGGYATGDIDIVAPSEPIDRVLRSWNFRREGRYWVSQELDIVVEAPSHSLEDQQYERICEVEIDALKVYILGIEDLIIDRLNAYVYWKSSDDGVWAKELIALHSDEIDWAYLESRARKEGTIEALAQLRGELEIK